MIVVLTGGSGGAKFAQGLARLLPPRELALVVNTGDDLSWWGLHVSPDLDSITYALAGLLSAERGWGIEGDTFACLDRMRALGAPAWFQLGDRDLATHLARTRLLASGKTLSQATAEIADGMGVKARILPMSDDPVETRVLTEIGDLAFQEYFVRERYQVKVRGVRFAGADRARPAPGVLDAIRAADAVLIAPSNPVTSIGPILAVAEIREALRSTAATVVAVSPIVAGAAVSGPAGELMQSQGWPVSAVGVAQAYRDFLDVIIVDEVDAGSAPAVEPLGIRLHCANIVIKSLDDKMALARTALELTQRAHSAVRR